MLGGLLATHPADLNAADLSADTLAINDSTHKPSPATVMLWNRPIVTFRSNYEELSPQERAKIATERLEFVPANLPEYRVTTVDVLEDGTPVTLIKVNGRIMFVMVPGEADAARGESFKFLKQQTARAVTGWLEAREAQRKVPLLIVHSASPWRLRSLRYLSSW